MLSTLQPGKPLGVHTRMAIIQLAMEEYEQSGGVFRRGWGVETARRFMVSEPTVSNLKHLALEFIQQEALEPTVTVDDLLLGAPPGNLHQQSILQEYAVFCFVD
jgi:hypothetical protein